jgi:hypothetical protein
MLRQKVRSVDGRDVDVRGKRFASMAIPGALGSRVNCEHNSNVEASE